MWLVCWFFASIWVLISDDMLSTHTLHYLSTHCPSMAGKTVVVTGANSGIGFKATEELLCLGAKVIMACRNVGKAQSAREALLLDYPSAEVEVRLLDVSSQASIQAFVDSLVRDRADIDAFVHNAGIFRIHGVTDEGEDIVMGTNYTGTRRLAECLLPYLHTLDHEVKMTFTTSISYRIGNAMPLADVSSMGNLKIYATSKLRLTQYAVSLAREESDGNVHIFLTHPGISITGIASKAFGESFMKRAQPLGNLLFQSPEKSALAIPLVLSNDLPAGTLYGPRGFLHSWGYPSRQNLHLPSGQTK